ncbi:MAG: ATP-binding protein, partial [Bacteroidota bacterium]
RGVKEADRLNKLVEDLLLSARLESAHQFHKEPIDLSELVLRLAHKLEQQHNGLQITIDMGTEDAFVNGDIQALTSVFLNLLENAVKYSPSPAQIAVSLKKKGGQIVISIADQGYGIKNAEKKNIFEKFYRIGNEDTRTTKGTGLGLFIVRELITSHQGSIKVIDNKPKGSVFVVQFPAIDSKKNEV